MQCKSLILFSPEAPPKKPKTRKDKESPNTSAAPADGQAAVDAANPVPPSEVKEETMETWSKLVWNALFYTPIE